MLHLRRMLRFTRRVLGAFHRNKGLLLASAVAFNALLSLIPLLGLVLVILSSFMDSQELLNMVARTVQEAVPRSARQITGAIGSFLENRAIASGVGAVVVVFFSAIAFRTLDDALSSIFKTAPEEKRRHPIAALVIPLAFMGLVVIALVLLSLMVTAVDMVPDRHVHFLTIDLSLLDTVRQAMRGLGFIGLVVLFASFYRIMPEAKVTTRAAAIGGLVAAVLWELMRRALAWYFANVSLVGVIYGSLTTVIVLLLTFEMAALILLLGGQVIAEILRSTEAGCPWYRDPSNAERELALDRRISGFPEAMEEGCEDDEEQDSAAEE